MAATLKQRILAGEPTFGSWITLNDPSVAEIMADSGFDWLTVDLEHSSIGTQEAGRLIQVIDRCGVTPLVRLSENDPIQIKRMMDAGAKGIIAPMVNSREQAERCVKAAKYPPTGFRSAGLWRAQGYGFDSGKYFERNNDESIVIVQIEHIEAVSNLESILSVPGIDAFIIGPYDLSGSLGVPGQFEHPKVKEALETVYATARRIKISAGFHIIQPSVQEVRERLKQGFSFIAISLDAIYLGAHVRRVLGESRIVAAENA